MLSGCHLMPQAVPPAGVLHAPRPQNCRIAWLDSYILSYFAPKNVVNLIIDIGNTAAKLAIFDAGQLVEVVHTDNLTLAGLAPLVGRYGNAIVSAVVSTVIDLSSEASARLSRLPFACLHIDSSTALPVTNLYETPATLGNDRIAAVVGANAQAPGRDILVIDSGTCITYDFVDAGGHFVGGNISPGIAMRFRALNTFTSRLPLVEARGRMPDTGKDTDTAIRLGVMRGVEYEVNGYVSAYAAKYPGLLVFLTGGDAFSFEVQSKSEIFADKFLVLKGLNRILEYNAPHI